MSTKKAAVNNVRESKKRVIDNTLERFKAASGVIVTNYQGLTVSQVNDLRRKLEKTGADYKVVKNTLSKRAIDDLKLGAEMKKLFKGVTGMAFCKDYMASIKVMAAFAKENENFKIKGGYIDSKEATTDEIKALSLIPSRHELLTKLAFLLNSPIRQMATVLDRVAKKNEEPKEAK